MLWDKGYQRMQVDAMVVGYLGSWDPANDPVLKKLGIGRKYATLFRNLCCTEAIKGSFTIWKGRNPNSPDASDNTAIKQPTRVPVWPQVTLR